MLHDYQRFSLVQPASVLQGLTCAPLQASVSALGPAEPAALQDEACWLIQAACWKRAGPSAPQPLFALPAAALDAAAQVRGERAALAAGLQDLHLRDWLAALQDCVWLSQAVDCGAVGPAAAWLLAVMLLAALFAAHELAQPAALGREA